MTAVTDKTMKNGYIIEQMPCIFVHKKNTMKPVKEVNVLFECKREWQSLPSDANKKGGKE